MADVIEVDFTPALGIAEQAEQALTQYDEWVREIKSLRRDVNWQIEWDTRELRRSRQRIRGLEEQIRNVQATEEEVLAALVDVYKGEPVHATTVAQRCTRHRCTQRSSVSDSRYGRWPTPGRCGASRVTTAALGHRWAPTEGTVA
jgi:hypothetical protein